MHYSRNIEEENTSLFKRMYRYIIYLSGCVCGVQSDFLCSFPHSGDVKILEVGQGTVRRSLLMSDLIGKGGKGKGSGVWPSMVTHTRNLSSAFNPSKCTLTAVNTHLEQWAAILRRPGSSWGIGALLKGLTSVVVLKVERALVIHSPHRQSLPDLGIEPATFGLQVQLSNH